LIIDYSELRSLIAADYTAVTLFQAHSEIRNVFIYTYEYCLQWTQYELFCRKFGYRRSTSEL